MNIVKRTLGLLLLLILLAVGDVVVKIVPIDDRAAYSLVSLTLLAVACVVAGYFLRTLWALLIVPVVFWGGAYLFGFLTNTPVSYTNPEVFRTTLAVIALNTFFLVVFSIPIVLLALLGILLGKRSARMGAAIAAY